MENNLILVENSTPDNILNTQITLGTINFDVDSVKEKVGEFLSKYNGLIIQQEDVKQIKSEIAFLRKQKELINKNRIKLSREFDIPLVQYKTDCDGIIDLIEESINELNSQVFSFEQKEKEEKRKEVLELIEKYSKLYHIENYKDFEFECKEQYLNKTMTIKKIENDLLTQLEEHKNFLQMEKLITENEKTKKKLLETTIIKYNQQYNLKSPLLYTEYESMIENINISEIDEQISILAKKQYDKENTIIKEDKKEKTKIEKIKIQNKKEIFLKLNITDDQLKTLTAFLENNNFDYEFEFNQKFDTKIEIIA